MITCCDQLLGTLHAMPSFSVTDGVGASMHFIAESKQPPIGDRCHCDGFRMIQIIQTTHPPAGRSGNGYVDNGGRSTPFYGDVYLARQGLHTIPNTWPDAGRQVRTTESIYDKPSRYTTGRTTDIRWMAETCVACVKNSVPDRILGGVTYGFNRNYTAATGSYGPVGHIEPSSQFRASDHFIKTLESDPTTASYSFEPAPTFIECSEAGDFPRPQGNTRLA
jgi:hypothetical protein